MMVSDPSRVSVPLIKAGCVLTQLLQWVKDVAEAGGKSYTFHIEATGKG